MSRKIKMVNNSKTYAEVFATFITAQAAKGVTDITIHNYHDNLRNISRFFDVNMPFDDLTKQHLDEMIVAMRQAGLAHNSISTYTRIVRTFLNWRNRAASQNLAVHSENPLKKSIHRTLYTCNLVPHKPSGGI